MSYPSSTGAGVIGMTYLGTISIDCMLLQIPICFAPSDLDLGNWGPGDGAKVDRVSTAWKRYRNLDRKSLSNARFRYLHIGTQSTASGQSLSGL
jgi:hypothetical protein